VSDQKIGSCLPLYLKNRLLLSALEDDDALPQDMGEDRQVLAQFRERASEQAVALLEELYVSLFGGATSSLPYRSDRQSQRRTVRDRWYVEGRLYRKHEKIARAYWNIILGSLGDKGPAVTLVLGPQDSASPVVFDELSALVAPVLKLESANPRNCFTHNAGYEAGVVVSFAPLSTGGSYKELLKGMKDRSDAFFAKFRAQFEAALDT
jgi:hypothetical protein